MNAPLSRLHRASSAPASTQFAPTLPMEAMHELAAVDETGWREVPPFKETQGRSQVSLTPLAGLTHSGRSGGAQDNAGPAPSVLHPLASATVDAGHDGAFHEPLGGLHMRELASPELFEHLFGSVEPR